MYPHTIPGRTSPNTSNTMPPPSTKNGSRNIYGYMVDVSKLTPEQRQQHDVMYLQNYHELCNINDPSSMFVSPPPIPNIESLSQSTISSLDSGSFGRNRVDVDIQQPTTLEVSNTETVMAYTEGIDLSPPQDLSNMFSAADFSSQSSSDSDKYKRAWHKAKVIRSYILSAGKIPEAFSRELSIALNHKEISSIMLVTGAILPKIYANVITRHEQKKKYCPMKHLSVIDENKQKTENLFLYPVFCLLFHFHQRK